MANGRFNRTIDVELEIDGGSLLTPGGDAASANTTGVAIGTVGSGDVGLSLIIDITALGGTHDATNFMTLTIEASDDDATYVPIRALSVAEIETGPNLVDINSRQITDAVGNQDATHYRINATQTGTTATTITVGAWFVESK